MHIVGTALGDVEYLRARIASVLGIEVVGDDFNFLNGREVQRTQGTAGSSYTDVGGGNAIHSDVISPAAPSVRVEAAGAKERIVLCDRRHARRRQDRKSTRLNSSH